MRAMNALGRRTFDLMNAWAAMGVGSTDAVAALFICPVEFPGRASPYNNYHELRDAPGSQYS